MRRKEEVSWRTWMVLRHEMWVKKSEKWGRYELWGEGEMWNVSSISDLRNEWDVRSETQDAGAVCIQRYEKVVRWVSWEMSEAWGVRSDWSVTCEVWVMTRCETWEVNDKCVSKWGVKSGLSLLKCWEINLLSYLAAGGSLPLWPINWW